MAGALHELVGPVTTHITPLENLQVNVMDFEVGGPGEVPPSTRPEQWACWEPKSAPGDAHNIETGCWIGKEGLRRSEEEEFEFLIFSYGLFLEETQEPQHREWEENQSGMRSSRSGMRLTSPRRRLGRAFLGPPPLIPPFSAEILWLNRPQRSRKVFWKLQNRPV